jgi:hypothetical protein
VPLPEVLKIALVLITGEVRLGPVENTSLFVPVASLTTPRTSAEAVVASMNVELSFGRPHVGTPPESKTVEPVVATPTAKKVVVPAELW